MGFQTDVYQVELSANERPSWTHQFENQTVKLDSVNQGLPIKLSWILMF